MKRLPLIALALASGLVPLRGATLERLSLDDMIMRSTAIVRARITDSWAAFSGFMIYTHYRIQVSERFKGSGPNPLEIVVPGGEANNLRQTFTGSPKLNKGDDFVLFLWTSKAGLTQVLGLTQGLFAVEPAAADPMTTREASQELMLDPTTLRPVKDGAMAMRLSELRSRISTRLGTNKGVTQ